MQKMIFLKIVFDFWDPKQLQDFPPSTLALFKS